MKNGVKYQITIKSAPSAWGKTQPRYTAYIVMDGISYSTKDHYEKKFTGHTIEEVEEAAKRWVDEQREPDPVSYIKRFCY